MSRIAPRLAVLVLVGSCGSVQETPDASVPIDASQTVTLAVSKTGNGTVTTTPTGITCGSTCSAAFVVGTPVTLTAVADAGSTFMGWVGGTCIGATDCSFDIFTDQQIRAVFVANNAVTVVSAGNGAGTVTSAPSGISCPTDCTEGFAPGTAVTLTATPATGSTFTGWSDGCTGTAACAVTVNAATLVTATFALEQHVLTVVRAGNGAGSVAATGIDCGSDCTETVDYGTAVTLTATPALGSVFMGWSLASCTGTGPCTTTITAASSVTATFALTMHTLSVTRSGTGTGTVTSSPAGITCGTVCDAMFNYGSLVTLTAAPTAGSTFTGWTGSGCTGTGTCVVTMTMARTVNAAFAPGCVTGGSASYAVNGTGGTGTLQTFTVPAGVCSIRIEAGGARGANNGAANATDGAKIAGTFTPTPGTVLTILVGQQPSGLGGGGGTFVMSGANALVIAGGGGSVFSAAPAVAETVGRTTTSGGTAGTVVRADGGQGGRISLNSNSGAGGGLSGNGGGAGGGKAYVNGGAGGVVASENQPGGYGGGGGRGGLWGQGGGGGYSGGSCGDTFDTTTSSGTWVGCGGGGSLNNGTSQANSAGANPGPGYVVITW